MGLQHQKITYKTRRFLLELVTILDPYFLNPCLMHFCCICVSIDSYDDVYDSVVKYADLTCIVWGILDVYVKTVCGLCCSDQCCVILKTPVSAKLQFVFAQQSSGGLGDLKDLVSIAPLTRLYCSKIIMSPKTSAYNM